MIPIGNPSTTKSKTCFCSSRCSASTTIGKLCIPHNRVIGIGHGYARLLCGGTYLSWTSLSWMLSDGARAFHGDSEGMWGQMPLVHMPEEYCRPHWVHPYLKISAAMRVNVYRVSVDYTDKYLLLKITSFWYACQWWGVPSTAMSTT
jgi:hypothetical protein